MTNLKISFFLILGLCVFAACEKHKNSGLPVDGDGNEYDTVVIGTQVWLTEDLKTSRYNNGVSIPLFTDNSKWVSMTSAGFCYYNNEPEKYLNNFGALYNWWAAKVSYLCPTGYHVATKQDWTTLYTYLGGEGVAGKKLKVTDINFWINTNCSSNESGFGARGSGARSSSNGTFNGLKLLGSWWMSSPEYDENAGWLFGLYNEDCGTYQSAYSKKGGHTIRCVKNN